MQYGTQEQKNMKETYNSLLKQVFAYHFFQFYMFDAWEYCVSSIRMFHCDLDFYQCKLDY